MVSTYANGSANGHSPILGPDGVPFQRPARPPLRDENGRPIQDEGGFLLPQYRTFGAIFNAVSHTYRWTFDEALRNSTDNALAMRRDVTIMDMLRERQLPTAQLKWHLEPEDPKNASQVAISTDLQKIVEKTPRWQNFMMSLLDAQWWGRAGTQLSPEWIVKNGRRLMVCKDHRPINGDKIHFDYVDGTPGVEIYGADQSRYGPDVVEWTDRNAVLMLRKKQWRERFIIHRHECDDADYFEPELAGSVQGVGIRSRIYWAWWMRQEVLSWMLDYLERVGLGLTIFYYDESNELSKQQAIKCAKEYSRNTVLAFPRGSGGDKVGSGIERLEASTAGNEVIKSIIDYFDGAMRRYIIGQTLSSMAEATGLGSDVASLHSDTKFRLIKYDAENLQGTLTNDFVKPMQFWNYRGEADFDISWKFGLDKPEPEKQLNAVTAAVGVGVTFKEDEVRELTGLSKPDEGDPTVGGKQAPSQPMMGGDPIEGGLGGGPGGQPQNGKPGQPQQPPKPPQSTQADDKRDESEYARRGPVKYYAADWDGYRMGLALCYGFEEGQHPRASDGRFKAAADAARAESADVHSWVDNEHSKKALTASESTKITNPRSGAEIRDLHEAAAEAHDEAAGEHSRKSKVEGADSQGESLMASSHNKAATLHRKASALYGKAPGGRFLPDESRPEEHARDPREAQYAPPVITDPQSVHNAAGAILEQDRKAGKRHERIRKDAHKIATAFGYHNLRNQPELKGIGHHETEAGKRGLTEVARHLAPFYPHDFTDPDDEHEETLQSILLGERKAMGAADAYKQAFEQMKPPTPPPQAPGAPLENTERQPEATGIEPSKPVVEREKEPGQFAKRLERVEAGMTLIAGMMEERPEVFADFRETEHPRAADGRFGDKAGDGGGKSAPSEKEVAKLAKKTAGTQPMTQKRARHGEIGPNGEVYPGGAFIATTDMPKREKEKIEKFATGRVQVDPGEWETPKPGQMSIFDKFAGTVLNHRNGEINYQFLEWQGKNSDEVARIEELVQKWRDGARWVSVNDYPELANIKDLARLVVAGEPVPGAVLSRFPEQWQKHLKKYGETKATTGDAKPIIGNPAKLAQARLADIPVGDLATHEGMKVRRVSENEWRLDTDDGHVQGDEAKITEAINRQKISDKTDRTRADKAIARASEWEEPDFFKDGERAHAETKAFEELPKGARVVSLEPATKGRVGTIVHDTIEHDGKPRRVNRVQLDGEPTFSGNYCEPLDTKLSWRKEKEAEAPKAKQASFFAKEAGHWITIGGHKGEGGKRSGGSPVYIVNGRITKGHPGLTGKKIGALKEGEEHGREVHVSTSNGERVGKLTDKPLTRPDEDDEEHVRSGESHKVELPDGRVVAFRKRLATIKEAAPEPKDAKTQKKELRQEQNQSRDYSRAVWAKKARKDGLDPKSLHQLAAEIREHDKEFTNDKTRILQEARAKSAKNGVDLSKLKTKAGGGKIDADSLRYFDEISEEIAGAHPEYFPDGKEGAADKLFEMLVAGNPEQMSEDEAYEQAFDTLKEHQEPVPFAKSATSPAPPS